VRQSRLAIQGNDGEDISGNIGSDYGIPFRLQVGLDTGNLLRPD
jgi:hypothetical protein